MNIAVAVIHGIGQSREDFYAELARNLSAQMAVVNPDVKLHVEGIYWGDIVNRLEAKLWNRIQEKKLRWARLLRLRPFFVNQLGEAIAYQAIPRDNDSSPDDYIYDEIHRRFAVCLQRLSDQAGQDAPLCIIAHSLGSIIASNFFYDLQNGKLTAKAAEARAENTPGLARGETLTHFYTLGSPLAVWALRFEDFGVPIAVPAPPLQGHGIGEWVNFYDTDDVIAYPIKPLNELYKNVVTADIEVKCPGLLSWTPLSHRKYFQTPAVIERIVHSLSTLQVYYEEEARP
ncbi:chemotaxis protein [Paenibacillus glycanilyticus]|uniref:chemotaxis protein n=1 Tax=Paenibacillus glycanilyticus TaxID=126569 RepID=UPI00203A9762|nr:chemotaxis protein [Paenibacillus glycanilyticus]MCM3631258.1 chemotaxis protein [Paenibacillus glycanilyticus]